LISCAIEALVWRALRLRVKFATKAARSRYANATGHQQLSLAETGCAMRFTRRASRSAGARRRFPATRAGAKFNPRWMKIGENAREG
jgi:hypothetical protein